MEVLKMDKTLYRLPSFEEITKALNEIFSQDAHIASGFTPTIANQAGKELSHTGIEMLLAIRTSDYLEGLSGATKQIFLEFHGEIVNKLVEISEKVDES